MTTKIFTVGAVGQWEGGTPAGLWQSHTTSITFQSQSAALSPIVCKALRGAPRGMGWAGAGRGGS